MGFSWGKDNWGRGMSGERYFSEWCKKFDINHTKGTKAQDLEQGIDYFVEIEGQLKSIDVKNTEKIYFLRIKDNKIILRHPFRPETQTEYYGWIKNGDLEQNSIEIITVKDCLQKSIKNQDSFKATVQDLATQPWTETIKTLQAVSPVQGYFKLKLLLQQYLQPGYTIIYAEDMNQEIPFYILKDKKTNDLLDSLRNLAKTTKRKKLVKKEPIKSKLASKKTSSKSPKSKIYEHNEVVEKYTKQEQTQYQQIKL